jgi:hypothetical protein
LVAVKFWHPPLLNDSSIYSLLLVIVFWSGGKTLVRFLL